MRKLLLFLLLLPCALHAQNAGQLVSLTPEVGHQLFDDTFVSLDTTNRWNAAVSASGGVAATVAANSGQLTLGSGTTTLGSSSITTQANFNQAAPGYIISMDAINLESPCVINADRFWGFGTVQGSPTVALPLIDGLGFELTTACKLQVVGFANGGGRTVIQDLSCSTGNCTQPGDSAPHKYFIKYRGDYSEFYIDCLAQNCLVATMKTGAPGPINNNLPKVLLAVAAATPPVSSDVVSDNASWVGETSANSTQISDGTYPVRKATVNTSGGLVVAAQSTDPCASSAIAKSHAFATITSATTTALVAVSGSTVVYVCEIDFEISGTTTGGTALFEQGTGAACAAAVVSKTATYTDAAGTVTDLFFKLGSGNSTFFLTTAANGVCAVTTVGSTPSIPVDITYVQQ